jgi:hypothetical protein
MMVCLKLYCIADLSLAQASCALCPKEQKLSEVDVKKNCRGNILCFFSINIQLKMQIMVDLWYFLMQEVMAHPHHQRITLKVKIPPQP